jgi:hypothetical protein
MRSETTGYVELHYSMEYDANCHEAIKVRARLEEGLLVLLFFRLSTSFVNIPMMLEFTMISTKSYATGATA